MTNIVKISEAASLAIHSMVVFSANPKRLVTTKDITSKLKVSEAHLSKVLQRLVRAGLITSVRGPKGGFKIKSAGKITLLNIYEAIDGRLSTTNCLFTTAVCGGRTCIFDKLLKKINKEFVSYLGGTKINDIAKNGCGRFWRF